MRKNLISRGKDLLVLLLLPLFINSCGVVVYGRSTQATEQSANLSNAQSTTTTTLFALDSWIMQFGSTTKGFVGGDNSRVDWCYSVTTDASGYTYCAGRTQGSFGEANSNLGTHDAFIMKINPSGQTVWVTQLGAVTEAFGGADNTRSDLCKGVAVDSAGNVYCAGGTQGALGEANANAGTFDAFIVKLNSSGQIQWLRQLGATTTAYMGADNTGGDICYGVSVDADGNVFCAGYTTGSLGETANSAGVADAFIMKVNSSGVLQWVKQLGATTQLTAGANAGWDMCMSVANDPDGNVICGGYTADRIAEVSAGGYDVFLWKLDTDGNLEWGKQLGSTTKAFIGADQSQEDYCYDIATDSSGNIYCAGITQGAVGEANGGDYDAFVLKVSAAGAVLWATQLGAVTEAYGSADNSASDACTAITVDQNDDVYCAGETAGNLGETNAGGTDAFVMKLNGSGALQWLTQMGTTHQFSGGDNSGDEHPWGVSVDSGGSVYTGGHTTGAMGEAFAGGTQDIVIFKLQDDGSI